MTESEGSASDMDIVTSDQAGSASVSESESESDTDDQMDDELNLLAPFDSTTAQRHKSTSALWLGVSTPLKAWPAVSSFCPLDVQQVRNLINEFFPGNKPITLELLNLHRFVSTLYTSGGAH
ncbi:hypothetical protein [Sporisorium scitamineum]|uniref:Uncharacterized protein n=1 Tax=Sporisorium scitamineum TaxID=49012 RepID=A0A0F7RXC5_9BASI|nr:hypothetical protein [Sporisorium scitamineum]